MSAIYSFPNPSIILRVLDIFKRPPKDDSSISISPEHAAMICIGGKKRLPDKGVDVVDAIIGQFQLL